LGDKDSAAKYNAIRSARNQSVSKFRSGRFRAITYRRLIDAYAASQEHQWHR
jgi:ribosomal protein S10